MRKTRELLEIMLENKHHFRMGLCGLASYLEGFGIFDRHERMIVTYYIGNHRPFNFQTIMGNAFYWKRGKLNPRVKWLKKHINKLK